MTKFATIILATLALASVGVPAQAQRFGIFFGDERSDFYPERILCLSDRQIRQAVADRGYNSIFLNVPNNKHIQVRASKGGWVYLLDFNYCTGQIESRQPLRPAN